MASLQTFHDTTQEKINFLAGAEVTAGQKQEWTVARLVEMHDGGGSPSQRRAFAEQVAAIMASSIRARSRSRSP